MTISEGGGGNSVAVTYERPEGLPGIKEAGGDNDDDDDGRGKWQGQEAEGKDEMSILCQARHVRQPKELPSINEVGGRQRQRRWRSRRADGPGGRGQRRNVDPLSRPVRLTILKRCRR